ncbi:MAG: DUF1801 domain-containing protein [Verrucomicrobiota bacterium]
MTSNATTISAYLAELTPDRQVALGKLRVLINRVAPEAVEGMDYGMPVFGDVCAFASQKHYMAFYACDFNIVDAHRSRLGKLNCGKCCIRFKRIEDLPLDVIESMLTDIVEKRRKGIGPDS